MNNIIKETYEQYNFPSTSKLSSILKKKGHKVKLADVKEFIDSQQEQQIHKTINKRVKGAPIVTAIPNFNYQADLLDFKR